MVLGLPFLEILRKVTNSLNTEERMTTTRRFVHTPFVREWVRGAEKEFSATDGTLLAEVAGFGGNRDFSSFVVSMGILTNRWR